MAGVYQLPSGTLVDAAEAADAAREAIRALNHITNNPGGLEYPGDVYGVLGSLASMVHMLPQALAQLQRFLLAELDADRVEAVAGQVHAGEPERAVLTAELHLANAAEAAFVVGRAMELAQAACAGLAGAGESTDQEGPWAEG